MKTGALQALTYVERNWAITFTPQAEAWFKGLPQARRDHIANGLDQLRHRGPGLGRPLVDSINGTPYHLKELRSGTTRLLFAFGSDRRAVMLVGGDKRGAWGEWYKSHVPVATKRFAQYEHTIGRGRSSRHRDTRAGNRSDGRAI